jgi:ATP-grasp domain
LGVVAKILSPDIVHKSEVGGVRLNLTSERAVREAVADILARARDAKPDARITGVTLRRPRSRAFSRGELAQARCSGQWAADTDTSPRSFRTACRRPQGSTE